jgi:hypothetical protein
MCKHKLYKWNISEEVEPDSGRFLTCFASPRGPDISTAAQRNEGRVFEAVTPTIAPLLILQDRSSFSVEDRASLAMTTDLDGATLPLNQQTSRERAHAVQGLAEITSRQCV